MTQFRLGSAQPVKGGMYRHANGGERYTLGELPESVEEAGLFDEASSVTVYDELPDEDRAPDYAAPDL